MFGECHAHIFMNGYHYLRAVKTHEKGPDEQVVRAHLKAYQDAGVKFVRDGGDRFGVSLLARSLAPEYGITYLTPGFAIHREGFYGKVVGEGYSSFKEYETLIQKLKANGGDFVKIMTTGILDFGSDGHVTGIPLPKKEVSVLVQIAHEAGFRVMAHTNTAQAVIDAAEAGVDSIEHGNYQNPESIQCMKEYGVVWVPTVVTVKNLIGCGRFPDEILNRVWETQKQGLRMGWHKRVRMALGSDVGAFMVPHGIGIQDEYRAFCKVLGASEELTGHLKKGEALIQAFHR